MHPLALELLPPYPSEERLAAPPAPAACKLWQFVGLILGFSHRPPHPHPSQPLEHLAHAFTRVTSPTFDECSLIKNPRLQLIKVVLVEPSFGSSVDKI